MLIIKFKINITDLREIVSNHWWYVKLVFKQEIIISSGIRKNRPKEIFLTELAHMLTDIIVWIALLWYNITSFGWNRIESLCIIYPRCIFHTFATTESHYVTQSFTILLSLWSLSIFWALNTWRSHTKWEMIFLTLIAINM